MRTEFVRPPRPPEETRTFAFTFAIGEDEFWVRYSFTVRDPNRQMHLGFAHPLLETV